MNASNSLLVMLPAFNEAATIGSVIERIPDHIEGISHISVLVIDDGSTDDTAMIAREAGASVISHNTNQGLGVAMSTALREAVRRGVDYAVHMDSDGQFSPDDIETLLLPLLSGHADFATASRFKDPTLVPVMSAVKRYGNAGMAWLISKLVGRRFDDVSCGFRAFSRESMLRLSLHGKFTYTQEMILALSYAGVGIAEIPVKVRGVREHGKSRIASSIIRYALRTTAIIFSCVRDYRPGLFFNTVSTILGGVSIALAGFFLWHWLTTGAFSPHLWAGFSAAFAFGVSIIIFFNGQVALMLSRQRLLAEEQLYYLRKQSASDKGKD